MNRTFATLLATIGACGVVAFAAPDAEAQHRRHHGHHGHHGARVGVYIGAPFLFSPWYYSRPYYDPYYQPVIVREQPVVYVEQQPAAAWEPAPAPQTQAQAQQPFWYFCQDTQTYYPHAQNCATPWQRVVPHAPR